MNKEVADNKAKGLSLKTGVTKNKGNQIFRETIISYLLIRKCTCAYQEVRNACFSENLAGFVFLQHRS